MQKYYANNKAISQSLLENSIEISAEQYEAAALAKINGQVVEIVNGELVIKAPYVKVTAYLKSDCTKQKEFDDVTLVTGDYTLKEPATRFDEWSDEEWVTNLQSQHQWQVNQVSETRYRLYLEVDRLRNEAVSIAETENDLDKAREYKLQADALYLKIRAENPWPVNPEA
ncbi:phage tail protein [Vibrio cholerae]|uniref:phage tail protein n=1 Tax=Vibrio cholerae TaxID=666 RepID=UPI0018C92684|nr:phage tail protein [Vibrio cholerae]EGR4262712.1 phage tail protein [Vibrio cholerae]EJL6308121.1 phage tail protein [Vibrio cholerae]EJS3365994.1 phage tail protein [Vibrio cholerae]EKA4530315.1 phage tail protein [Vibrio cholerae]